MPFIPSVITSGEMSKTATPTPLTRPTQIPNNMTMMKSLLAE